MLMLIDLLQETVAKCWGDGKTRGGKYYEMMMVVMVMMVMMVVMVVMVMIMIDVDNNGGDECYEQ